MARTFTARYDGGFCALCGGPLWEGDELRYDADDDLCHADCLEDDTTPPPPLTRTTDEPWPTEMKGTTAMTAPTGLPPWMTGGTAPTPSTPDPAPPSAPTPPPVPSGPPTGLPPWMTQSTPAPEPVVWTQPTEAELSAMESAVNGPVSVPAPTVEETDMPVSVPVVPEPDDDPLNHVTPATVPQADWEPDLSVDVTAETERGPAPLTLGVVELSGRKLFGVVINGQLSHMSYADEQFPGGWAEMLDKAMAVGGWTFLAGDPFIQVSVAELREALTALRLIPRKPPAEPHSARIFRAVTVPPSQAAKMMAVGMNVPGYEQTVQAAAEHERAASVQAAVEQSRAAMGASFKANEPVSPAEEPPFDADPDSVDMSGAESLWNQFVTAKHKAAELAEQVKELRQGLEDYHAGVLDMHPELAGCEFWTINGVKVAKFATVESSRFDVKAYQEAHPRLAKKFTKTTTSKRLDIL